MSTIFGSLYSLLLEVDWSFLPEISDISEAVSALYNKMYNIFDREVDT